MLSLFVLMLAVLHSPQFRDTFLVPHWREQGRRDAERDIAAGTMKLKCYGLLIGHEEAFETSARQLRERFGVEVVYIGDGFFSEPLDYAKSYNERIEEELDHRHGPDWRRDTLWEEGVAREPGGEDGPGRRLVLIALLFSAGIFLWWLVRQKRRQLARRMPGKD